MKSFKYNVYLLSLLCSTASLAVGPTFVDNDTEAATVTSSVSSNIDKFALAQQIKSRFCVEESDKEDRLLISKKLVCLSVDHLQAIAEVTSDLNYSTIDTPNETFEMLCEMTPDQIQAMNKQKNKSSLVNSLIPAGKALYFLDEMVQACADTDNLALIATTVFSSDLEIQAQINKAHQLIQKLATQPAEPKDPATELVHIGQDKASPLFTLTAGFSGAEGTHRWTEGKMATITFPASAGIRPTHVNFANVSAFLPAGHTQCVLVKLNDRLLNAYVFSPDNHTQTIDVVFPDAVGGDQTLVFETPNALSPGADPRLLGILFREMKLDYKK